MQLQLEFCILRTGFEKIEIDFYSEFQISERKGYMQETKYTQQTT